VDFKDLLRLVGRRWKTIAAMFGLGVVAAAAFTFSQTPMYHSTARVFISTDDTNPASAFYASAFGTQRVQSYADLATSGQVMNEVIKRLDLNLTPAQLASKVSATVATNTVLITLEVKDPSARVAQQLTRALSTEFTSYLAEVETPTGKDSAPVKATVTDEATFDGTAVSPDTVLNIAIGAILGLIIGAALAVVRDLLDTTIKTPHDIETAAHAAVMTHVAYDPSLENSPLLTDAGTESARAEAFRVLRTNLQFLDLDNPPRSLVVTSAVPNEGKTTTATNLAIALAQAGKQVLLVDGDLRRPQVAKRLHLETSVGLTTVLVGRSDVASSVQVHHDSGVHVLSSGPIPPNPTEVLQSQAMRHLVARLQSSYEYVIIDAPPLLPVADASIMSTDTDGSILVTRHAKTTKEQLRQAANRIEQVGGRLFGVVVNMSPRRKRGYDGYGYGYGYGYEAESAQKSSRRRRG